MDEKKKMGILISIVAAVILLIIGGSIYESQKSKKALNDFYTAFKSTENKLIMVGQSSYTYNDSDKVILDQLKESDNLDYFYLDIDSLDVAAANKVYEKLGITKDEFSGIYIVIAKDDAVVDAVQGYINDSELLDFVKENELVPSSAKLVLNHVDYNGYKKVAKSDEASILVIGQTTCGHCARVKPILSKISKDYGITINYLDIIKLSSEEQQKFTKYIPFLEEDDSWGTPLTLIVKNGEVLDSVNGALDKDGYVKFFKDNGFIKQVYYVTGSN